MYFIGLLQKITDIYRKINIIEFKRRFSDTYWAVDPAIRMSACIVSITLIRIDVSSKTPCRVAIHIENLYIDTMALAVSGGLYWVAY